MDEVVTALRDPAVADHGFDGMFGRTTVAETFGAFYCFDLVVHRWDLACALGATTTFDDDELDLVERLIELAGDALHGEGTCDDPVEIPAGAPRSARLRTVVRNVGGGAGPTTPAGLATVAPPRRAPRAVCRTRTAPGATSRPRTRR